jgi:hypothetical protein
LETEPGYEKIDHAVRTIQDVVLAHPEVFEGLRFVLVLGDGNLSAATHVGYGGEEEAVVMSLLRAAQELAEGTALGITVLPMAGPGGLN